MICLSGDIGFCPVPHLHIQMHSSSETKSPTIPFLFIEQPSIPLTPSKHSKSPSSRDQDSDLSQLSESLSAIEISKIEEKTLDLKEESKGGYIPQAGQWYNYTGRVDQTVAE